MSAACPPLIAQYPPMTIFQPHHIRLVEQALRRAPEGMTGKEVWEATDRVIPERTVHLILGDLVHDGKAERLSTSRSGRRARQVFRVVR